MVKLSKKNAVEFYEAEKECHRVYSREVDTSTEEERDAAGKRAFITHALLFDGEEDSPKSMFILYFAMACVEADISVSRFLKCLEICGVEVEE